MEWGQTLGDLGAKFGCPLALGVVTASLQFEARYEGRHGIDVIADDLGTAACGLDEASAPSDKWIENNRPLERKLPQVHIPELLRLSWF